MGWKSLKFDNIRFLILAIGKKNNLNILKKVRLYILISRSKFKICKKFKKKRLYYVNNTRNL
jgi:hypothetical protein